MEDIYKTGIPCQIKGENQEAYSLDGKAVPYTYTNTYSKGGIQFDVFSTTLPREEWANLRKNNLPLEISLPSNAIASRVKSLEAKASNPPVINKKPRPKIEGPEIPIYDDTAKKPHEKVDTTSAIDLSVKLEI